jgi:hypothetical protein
VLKVLFIFYSAFFHYTIGLKSNFALAFLKLIGTSFNVPEKFRYHFKTIFSGIKTAYGLPVISLPLVAKGPVLVYDLAQASERERLGYLRDQWPSERLSYISADTCMGFKSRGDKWLFLLASIPAQLIIVFVGLIKKERSGINSILTNLLLTRNLVAIIRQSDVRKIVLFSAYDTNSAFLSVNLQKCRIDVITVTSEVPLYKWNAILVTDVLHVCSSYQLEELKYLPNISYKSLETGAPEKYFEVKGLYTSAAVPNNKLGFISTGGWVRKKLGHIDQGIDIELFERKILGDLNTILAGARHISLVVYPHPRELRYFEGSKEELNDFYKNMLPDIDFAINFSGKPTGQLFDECYLAICFMSTSIFERLHAKRKSAVIYFKEHIFPVPFVSRYLSFLSGKQELEHLINENYPSRINT